MGEELGEEERVEETGERGGGEREEVMGEERGNGELRERERAR